MARPVYVSSTCFEQRDIPSVLSAAANLGADGIEFSVVENFSEADIDQIDRFSSELPCLAHNYFPPAATPFVLNLGATESDLRVRSVRHAEFGIELCARWGAPFYAAHSGFRYDFTPEDLGRPDRQRQLDVAECASYEEFLEALAASASLLAETAAGREIQFLLENNVVSPESGANAPSLIPMAGPNELRDIFDAVSVPAFGLLLDFGHLKVSANALGFEPEEMFRLVGEHIKAFHVSDNAGNVDSNEDFDETAWFLPILKDYPGVPVTIETNRSSGESVLRMINIIRNS